MTPTRRPRGSLVDAVALGYKIERPVKKRLDDMARDAGVTGAAMLEFILANIDVDDRGVPTIWPVDAKEGELPIDSA